MQRTTYNQLIVFQTIVKEGSIRGAARKLEIAPPSVSQALKLLEQNLGLPLFNRTTRRIELTEAGQLLRDNTASAIAALNYALESVHDLRTKPTGKVRLTIPRFAYQLFLQALYAQFCATYPELQLEVSVSDAAVDIIAEGFDAGIRLGDRVEEGMVAKQLTPPMHEALFASPDYVARYGMPSKLEELYQHRLIQYRFISSNKIAPLYMSNDGQRLEVKMPTALIVNDTDMMVDAALNGLGIGRVVAPMVDNALKNGRLLPILKSYWQRYPGLHIYFPQHSQKARRIRVLLDFLEDRAITRF